MPIALLIYKQRDPVPNKKNTPPSNFHHVKYIATRPRVMKNELSNHGLFGNAATGGISAIESLHKMQKLILQKSYERKNIHRGVISFTAETAKQLGLKRKEDFQKLVKQNTHILAEKNGIKVENLRWVAAAHNERKHSHVHIMFWDDAQTMPQSYVNPKIPNEIRKQLIKSIFAAELTAYYEEKKKATVSLRQISGEMVEEFEKAVTSLNPKAFKELKELIDNEEVDSYHWNAEFVNDSLIKLAKELFELKAKLPKTGRLSFQFLSPELKEEMIKFVDNLITSNAQLQSILAPQKQMELDRDLLAKGEKPEIYLDFPIDVADYELIDLFNWQDEVKDMISQLEFVRMVDVQSETIERYIREGKIKPDLEVPVGDKRSFKYFKEDNVKKYASEFGWELITAANMKDKFMEMVKTMDMSFSYKPVLLLAMFEHVDESGRVRVKDIIDFFIDFYGDRKNKGLFVEKKSSIFCRDGFTRKDVERNIFANPFKRFEDMRFMKRCREIEFVEFNKHVFKKLTKEDIEWIKVHCDGKMGEYYGRYI